MVDYITNAANNVLKATEEITIAMEEGLTAMMTGSLPTKTATTGSSSSSASSATGEENDINIIEDEEEMIEEEFMDSPLQGMAESVINDIMEKQVKIIVVSTNQPPPK